MIGILTLANAGHLFASAGQATVERALLGALAATGRVRLRLVLQGEPHEIRRVEQAYGPELAAGSIEIDVSPEGLHRRHGDGMTGIMQHAVPEPGLVNAMPLVLHLHSLELDPQGRWEIAEACRRWDGTTPYVVLAPSESTAARARWLHARARPGSRRLPPVLVLPHGVDSRRMASGDRARGRARLRVDETARVLLSLNRLSPKKLDYRQLLAAFAALPADGPRAVLVAAGGVAPEDREHPAAIERWAAQLGVGERVRVLPHVDEPSKPDLLAAADALVSPATHPQESFGLVLLEAAAAGLPVVATDWNGYREVLPDEHRRWSVPTVASHGLARKLDWCGGDDALTRAAAASFDGLVAAMGDAIRPVSGDVIARGRDWARRRDWAGVAQALLALWDELAAGRSAFRETGPARDVCSPVDGLATRYLEGSTRLVATGREPPLALDRLADGRPLPRAARAEVTRTCTGGATLGAVRAALDLPPEDVDDIVLELLRFGALALEEPR